MDSKASADHVRLKEINLRVVGISAAAVTWREAQDAAFTDLPSYSFLTELENKLIHWYWYQGKDYPEIAIAFKMSYAAVKARLARIYAKLRNREDILLRGRYSSGGCDNGAKS
jgi:hypothetical protein